MSWVKDTFFGGAEKEAGKTVETGALEGIAEQRRQFDITQENLRPAMEAGNLALASQQALLGLSGKDAQEQAFAGLIESPGQQFLRKRQERSLLRNASAIGGLGGGNVRTALQEQAMGFAQQDLQNQFGRLGQLAGQGQAATTNLGQFGSTMATNIQQGLGAAGQARASGILGKAAGARAGIQQVAGGAAGYFGGGGALGALQGTFGV